MATHVTLEKQNWLRLQELLRQVNAVLADITPWETDGCEVPWSITDRELRTILAVIGKDRNLRQVHGFREFYSDRLVHHLSLIASAQLSGQPLSPEELLFLFTKPHELKLPPR